MTQSENNIFLGYENNQGDCSWIEWISYRHANPSQLTHAVPVMWFIGTVLLLSCSMLIVSAFWSDVQHGGAFARAIEERALPAHYNIWQDRIVFSEVRDFLFHNVLRK